MTEDNPQKAERLDDLILPPPDPGEKRVYTGRQAVQLPDHIKERIPYDKARIYVAHEKGIKICLIPKKGKRLGKHREVVYGYLTTVYNQKEQLDNNKNIAYARTLAKDHDSLITIIEKALEEKCIKVPELNRYIIRLKTQEDGSEYSLEFKKEFLIGIGAKLKGSTEDGLAIITTTHPIDKIRDHELVDFVGVYALKLE